MPRLYAACRARALEHVPVAAEAEHLTRTPADSGTIARRWSREESE
jgi:hypothetical protein